MGQREIYAKEVLPYLNSTPEIDNGFISLISIWERDNLETSDLELAKSIFRELAYASQNIYSNWKEEYIIDNMLLSIHSKKKRILSYDTINIGDMKSCYEVNTLINAIKNDDFLDNLCKKGVIKKTDDERYFID